MAEMLKEAEIRKRINEFNNIIESTKNESMRETFYTMQTAYRLALALDLSRNEILCTIDYFKTIHTANAVIIIAILEEVLGAKI